MLATCPGLPEPGNQSSSRAGRRGRSEAVGANSTSEEDDDTFLLGKALFDLKVRPCLYATFLHIRTLHWLLMWIVILGQLH